MLTLTTVPPPYVQHLPGLRTEESIYLASFVTDRALQGTGVGSALLQAAEAYAVRQECTWLQVDCWAGQPELPAYYQRMGFLPVDTFLVDAWPGMFLEKAVSAANQLI
jgi:GNAT superfamily N-acetyltransferase